MTKMTHRISACMGALLIAVTPVCAQQTELWSLERCIRYGQEHSIEIQQKQVEIDNRKISMDATQYSRLPAISANMGENLNIGRSQNRQGVYEDRTAHNTSLGVSASLPVFEGFRINRQAKADRISLEAATRDMEQAKQDLSLQIVAAYLQVLYCKESEAVAEKQVETGENLVEHTSALVNGGKRSESDLYDAKSALARSRSELVDARNNTALALLDLAQSINYNDYRHFDIEIPDVENMMYHEALLITPVDSIYTDYLDRKPGIIAARLRVDEAMQNIKVAKSGYWPSIDFGVSYGTGYYSSQAVASGNGTFWNQLGVNGSTSIGASLRIPIFSRMSTTSNVKIAKNNARMQQLALEQTKKAMFKEVQQAYVNAEGAYNKYLADRQSVQSAQKAFEYEQKKYENGRSTAYQYNETRQKLVSATASMMQAKYNFLLRAKILAFYKGEPLC